MYARDLLDRISPKTAKRRWQSFSEWRDTHAPEIAQRIATRTFDLRRAANSVEDGGDFSVDTTYHLNPKGLQRSQFEVLMCIVLDHEVNKRIGGQGLPLRLDRIETVTWEPAKYDPRGHDSITFRTHYIVSR